MLQPTNIQIKGPERKFQPLSTILLCPPLAGEHSTPSRVQHNASHIHEPSSIVRNSAGMFHRRVFLFASREGGAKGDVAIGPASLDTVTL